MVAGNLSIEFNLRGFIGHGDCVYDWHTHIGLGHATIAAGDTDAMFVTAQEMGTTPVTWAGLQLLERYQRNDDPKHASRQQDKDRDGFVLGDGAVMMMLESLEIAQARGRLCGSGWLWHEWDTYHMTSPPEMDQCCLAMRNALRDAGMNPSDVGPHQRSWNVDAGGDVAKLWPQAYLGHIRLSGQLNKVDDRTSAGAAGAVEQYSRFSRSGMMHHLR